MKILKAFVGLILFFSFILLGTAQAHHVLGVNPAGKTELAPQIPSSQEIMVGDYLISLTMLPGHPIENQITRIIAYTKNLKTGKPFMGKMEFRVKSDAWFNNDLISQSNHFPIEDRHIMALEFTHSGNYLINLGFTENSESYNTSIPFLVGDPNYLPYYLGGGVLFLGLLLLLRKAQQNRRKVRPV